MASKKNKVSFGINDNERVFVLRPDNSVFEMKEVMKEVQPKVKQPAPVRGFWGAIASSQCSAISASISATSAPRQPNLSPIKVDLCLVKIDDYISMLDLKIKEICSNVIYESDATHTKQTESDIYGVVYNKIVSEGIFDLFSFDVDASSIKIKPVIDFLINVNSKFIDEIINLTAVESDPDLDFSTALTIKIKALMSKNNSNARDVRKLSKILLLTNMVMKYFAELKAPSKNSNVKEEPEVTVAEDQNQGLWSTF